MVGRCHDDLARLTTRVALYHLRHVLHRLTRSRFGIHHMHWFSRLLGMNGMVIATGCSVLAASILQKVDAIGFVWTLWQELQDHALSIGIRTDRIQHELWGGISLSNRPSNVQHLKLATANDLERIWRWMMKLASLAKLARPVFHEVLTNGFIRANRKHRFIGIQRLYSTTTLHIRGMIVLAGGTIFTPSRAQIVATVLRSRHSLTVCPQQSLFGVRFSVFGFAKTLMNGRESGGMNR